MVLRYYSGKIDLTEIISSMKDLAALEQFSPEFNILNDIRDAEVRADETEIKQLIDFIKQSEKLYGERKSVLLTDKPDQVVFGLLANLFNINSTIMVITVSTVKNAIRKLGIINKYDDYITDNFKYKK